MGFSAHASRFLVTAVPLICVVSLIMTIGLAVERFPFVSLAMLLLIPIIGGVYFAVTYKLGNGTHKGVGVALIGIGIGTAILAGRGFGPDQTTDETPVHQT